MKALNFLTVGRESGAVVEFNLNAFAKRYAAAKKSSTGASLPPFRNGSFAREPLDTAYQGEFNAEARLIAEVSTQVLKLRLMCRVPPSPTLHSRQVRKLRLMYRVLHSRLHTSLKLKVGICSLRNAGRVSLLCTEQVSSACGRSA